MTGGTGTTGVIVNKTTQQPLIVAKTNNIFNAAIDKPISAMSNGSTNTT